MAAPVRQLRRWPALVALSALPALLVATPLLAQGLTYDFKVTSTATDGAKTRELNVMAGRGQVEGTNARIDLSEAKNGGPMFGSKGGYVLVKESGAKMYMVDPGEKQYYLFNTDQMMAGLNSSMRMIGGMVKMTMTDPKLELQDLGAGERIQGYATRHVRQLQSVTMSVSVLGRKSSTTSADTTDIWIAPDLKLVVNPFLRMGTSAAAALDFGNPEFRQQLLAVQAKMPAGLALRSVMHGTSTDDKGKVTKTETRMEVTNLQKGAVAAAAFALPAGYTEVEMPFAELAALGDSLDAAKARQGSADAAAGKDSKDGSMGDGVKDAVKEAGKESAKKQAAKKLRGIFKRPPR